MDLGRVLRAYREKQGLSQQQVADQLGLSRHYVSLVERGLRNNLSFSLARRILNLGESHGKIWVTLTQRVKIDATIAPEIVWLNSQGVVTEGCCEGPPPTALITPGSIMVARRLGYEPEYDVGLFEINLKSEVRC